MRRPVVVALVVLGAGLVALVLAAALHSTPRAMTLGVKPGAPVAALNTGDIVCQRPIDVSAGAGFDVVDMSIGTYHRAGSPLLVTANDLAGRRLAGAQVPGGYPDIGEQQAHHVRLDRMVTAPRRVNVCVRNVGPRRVALYGDVDLAARSSSAYLDGKPVHVDVALDFDRSPRSMASLVPRMLDRAALFRFAGMGPWVYVVLAALLLVAAPWLLVRALASADVSPRDEARRQPRDLS